MREHRAVPADLDRWVLAGIEELRRLPAGVRAPAGRRADVIALVLPLRAGIHLPVAMQVAFSVVTTAREYGHDALLVTADEGPAALARVAAGPAVDGLVVMDVEMDDPRAPVLRTLRRPSVLIGHPGDTTGLTCVDLDFRQAGADCVQHLARLGHRAVGLLGAPGAVYDRGTGFAQRVLAGVLSTAFELGLRAAWSPCEEGPDGVPQALDVLLECQPAITGLVVHNEAACEYLIGALRAVGRRVPADMSVVAVCPGDVAERGTPPLTSVLVPTAGLGAQAVRLLMRRLRGQPVEECTLTPPRLVRRASTAGPPATR